MATARPISVLSLLFSIGLTLAACATSSNTETSGAFETEPVAPSPSFQIEWRRSVDVNFVGSYRSRQYARPTVLRAAGRRELVVGTDSGWLYRYRASDAQERWSRELDGPIHAAPAVTASRVYAGTLHGTLYAIDRQSGEVAWINANDRGIEADPAVSDGIVFYTTNAGRLVAVDEADGQEVWTYRRDIPKEFTVKGSGTPVVADNVVYCGFADGTIVAVGKTTGEKLWETNVAGGETDFTDVDGPVFIQNDRLFVSSYGAGITALDRQSGETIWARSFENVSSAIYTEGSIYLTIATGRVVALNSENGAGKWGFAMNENLPVDVRSTGNYLFISTGNGPLYVLDRATGYPLRRWSPASGMNAPIAISDRSAYALSNDGYLYSLRLRY